MEILFSPFFWGGVKLTLSAAEIVQISTVSFKLYNNIPNPLQKPPS